MLSKNFLNNFRKITAIIMRCKSSFEIIDQMSFVNDYIAKAFIRTFNDLKDAALRNKNKEKNDPRNHVLKFREELLENIEEASQINEEGEDEEDLSDEESEEKSDEDDDE